MVQNSVLAAIFLENLCTYQSWRWSTSIDLSEQHSKALQLSAWTKTSILKFKLLHLPQGMWTTQINNSHCISIHRCFASSVLMKSVSKGIQVGERQPVNFLHIRRSCKFVRWFYSQSFARRIAGLFLYYQQTTSFFTKPRWSKTRFFFVEEVHDRLKQQARLQRGKCREPLGRDCLMAFGNHSLFLQLINELTKLLKLLNAWWQCLLIKPIDQCWRQWLLGVQGCWEIILPWRNRWIYTSSAMLKEWRWEKEHNGGEWGKKLRCSLESRIEDRKWAVN